MPEKKKSNRRCLNRTLKIAGYNVSEIPKEKGPRKDNARITLQRSTIYILFSKELS